MHVTRGIRVQEQILNTNKTRGNLISNTPQAACDETRKIFLVHSNVQVLGLEIYNLLFRQAPCFLIIYSLHPSALYWGCYCYCYFSYLLSPWFWLHEDYQFAELDKIMCPLYTNCMVFLFRLWTCLKSTWHDLPVHNIIVTQILSLMTCKPCINWSIFLIWQEHKGLTMCIEGVELWWGLAFKHRSTIDPMGFISDDPGIILHTEWQPDSYKYKAMSYV
jgi:hypothetical protein